MNRGECNEHGNQFDQCLECDKLFTEEFARHERLKQRAKLADILELQVAIQRFALESIAAMYMNRAGQIAKQAMVDCDELEGK